MYVHKVQKELSQCWYKEERFLQGEGVPAGELLAPGRIR